MRRNPGVFSAQCATFGLIAARDCMYANDHAKAKSIQACALMKPPPFDYMRAGSVQHAVALLAERGDDAKIIAGGQSLMPMLAFRMATPKLLVDIGAIAALRRITVDARAVTLGALVRWCDIEKHAGLAQAHPLLVEAVRHVAHYQIRNRGTIGGSLAHADPAAELPGIAVACDAEIEVVGPKGHRTITAADFFVDSLTTALAPNEVIVSMRLPAWESGRCWAFEEFARRRGDFALAGVALFYDLEQGRAVAPHIAAIGVGATPVRLTAAEQALAGKAVDQAAIREAVAAATARIDPPGDIHAPGDYRRALLAVLLERALARAAGLKLAESA
jgi:aerobic carbon-monoxide dehydrogenase medium subunit